MKVLKSALSVLILSNKINVAPASAFILPKIFLSSKSQARDKTTIHHKNDSSFVRIFTPLSYSIISKPHSFSSLRSTSEDTQQPSKSIARTTNLNENEAHQKLPPLSNLEGVIFDMDGTLLHPCIDFATMRSRIYKIANQDELLLQNTDIPKPVTSGCVLEYYEKLSEDGQKQAKVVFEEIEADAIQNMRFMEDMVELMKYLDRKGIRRAVLTRNVETSVVAMQDKLWKEEGVPPFFPTVARDTFTDKLYKGKDGEEDNYTTETNLGTNVQPKRPLIPKPDPDSIFHICQQWHCDPKNVIMVGDSASDDIRCANRASCASVLLKYKGEDWDNDSGNSEDAIEAEMEPTETIQRLGDLQKLLEEDKKFKSN